MTYAVSAIPIWLAKLGMLALGLKFVCNEGLKAFEWIFSSLKGFLYEDFSSEIMGYSDGNFHFFPSPSSAFYIPWLVFLGLFLALIVFSIIWFAIKKQRENVYDTQKAITGSQVVEGFILACVGVSFIPFILMTGLSITNTVTKLTFSSTEQNVTEDDINAYNNDFYNGLYSSQDQINNIGEASNVDLEKLYTDYLISHTDLTSTDTFMDGATGDDFELTADILDRLITELTYIETNSSNIMGDDFLYLVIDLKDKLQTFNDDLIKSEELKENLYDLATYAQNITKGVDDLNVSNDILDTVFYLEEYLKSYYAIEQALFDLLNQRDDLLVFVHNGIVEEVSDTGEEDELTPAYDELKVVISSGWETTREETFSNDEWQILSNNNLVEDAQTLIALNNIYYLTSSFLNPQIIAQQETELNTSDDETSLHEIFAVIDLYCNDGVVINGQKYSLMTLSNSYLEIPRTPVTGIINDIFSWGVEQDIVTEIVFIPVSWAILLMLFGILYQILKRIITRIVKLVFLWFSGMVILPSSVNDGGRKMSAWWNLVFNELIMVFGIALGLMVWENLCVVFIDWAESQATGDQSWITDSITGPVLEIMIVLISLELIVLSGDWLSEILGANTSLEQVRGNLSKASRWTNKSVDSSFKTQTEFEKKMEAKQKNKDSTKALPKGKATKTASKPKGLKKGTLSKK